MSARVEIAQQTSVFLGACLLGALLGLCFDLVRTIRLTLPHNAVATLLEDIAYWCLASLATALYLINTNDGQIRAFILVGEGLGALLYGCTLSRLVRRVGEGLVALLRAVVFRPLGRLVAGTGKLLWGMGKFLLRILGKPWFFLKNRLKRAAHLLYNKRKAQCSRRKKGSGADEEEPPQGEGV